MTKKGIFALVLTMVLAFSAFTVYAADTEDASYDASKLTEWFETEGLWRTVVSTSFKAGAENLPTEEDLSAIMKFSSLTPTSGGKTDYMMVVLTDPEEQQDVVGTGNANDGTVTVLVFGDRLLPQEESLINQAQQLDRGYYNVGIASGYLNVAAVSKGYGTHFYMTTTYTNPNAPKEKSIEETYLMDKGYQYGLGWDRLGQGDENGLVDAYGNVKFVCAIVIGTLDEQAETHVTDHHYPENWAVAK